MALEVRGVSKSFGSDPVLHDIDFSLEAGKTGVIVGPSGVGKTTLLNIIAGVITPDSGRVSIGGRIVEEANGVHIRSVERKVGYVFQDYLLFPHMTVFENVAYGLRARHVPKPTIERKVVDSLEVVGLRELRDKRPDEISGGQKQRVSLARAMVLEPSVLLLDEPLSALDRPTRETLRTELRRIFSNLAITVLYVTHDLDEAFFFGQEIGVMKSGRLSFFGEKNRLLTHMSSSTAEFLGFNLLKARFLRLTGSDYAFLAHGWGSEMSFPLADQPELRAGDEVLVAIAPGSIEVSRDRDSSPGVDARVIEVWEFKDRAQVVVGNSESKVVSEIPSREFSRLSLKPGDTVRVRFNYASLIPDAF